MLKYQCLCPLFHVKHLKISSYIKGKGKDYEVCNNNSCSMEYNKYHNDGTGQELRKETEAKNQRSDASWLGFCIRRYRKYNRNVFLPSQDKAPEVYNT